MRWTVNAFASLLILVSLSPAAFSAKYRYTTIQNSANPNDALFLIGLNDNDVLVGEDSTSLLGFAWANATGQTVSGTTYLSSINDNGIAVGALNTAGEPPSVVTYDVAGGTLQYFPIPIDVDSIDNVSINSSKEITGTLLKGKRSHTAFVLMPNGSFMKLALPHGKNCFAYGLNDSGTIVGRCINGAFTYSNGSYQTVKVPNSTSVNPSFITESGVIGGDVIIDSVDYGFTYESGKATTFIPSDIPNFGAFYAIIGILPNGDILGNYFTPDGSEHGFIYDGKTKKSLQIDAPNAQSTNYTAVNAKGDLIGSTYNPGYEPFIATCQGGKTCLK